MESKIQLISNQGKEHYKYLSDFIKTADKIDICVAFLKESGIGMIINELEKAVKAGTKVNVFCGIDFYSTEPAALKTLLSLFKPNKNSKLYVYNSRSGEVFHPKIYVFSRREKANVIVGSANMTLGGMKNNVEVSLLYETNIASADYKQVQKYLETIEASEFTKEVDTLFISQYAAKFKVYKKAKEKYENEVRQQVEEIKIMDIDAPRLKEFVVDYQTNRDLQSKFKARKADYDLAKGVLDDICDTTIRNKEEFLALYGRIVGQPGEHLWASGSIFRHKNMVAENFKLVIKMIKIMRKNIAKSPEYLFSLGQKYSQKIKGLGPNVITEILNTYNVNKFAILNNNPLSVLKLFGSELPPTPAFTPQIYAEYSAQLIDFKVRFKFESLNQVDDIFNSVFWEYVD